MKIWSILDAIYDTEILMTTSLPSYSSVSSTNNKLLPLQKIPKRSW